MRYYSEIKITLFYLLTFCFLTVIVSCSAKKEADSLKPFEINIQKTADNFVLKCTGCAWTDLSFDLGKQAVNELGMTTLEEDPKSDQDQNLADFLFVIEPTQEGAKMKSLKGTSWDELSFDLQKKSNKSLLKTEPLKSKYFLKQKFLIL